MRKVWIVVANSTKAIIYKAENVSQLMIHHTMEHPEGHLSRRDLVTDRKGATFFHGSSSDSLEEPTPIKVKEAKRFADEVSKYLESHFLAKEFERLYLVAKPPFLNHLRQSLSPNVVKVVESEIHKDLTLLRSEQIREYLPPAL